MIRYIKNCHRNIKSMSNKIYRYPHLENVFEKHKRIRIVHIVFFHNHGNQLITQYKCNNHPRNGDNDIIRQIFYHGKNATVPILGCFPNLCSNRFYFGIYIGKHGIQV